MKKLMYNIELAKDHTAEKINKLSSLIDSRAKQQEEYNNDLHL
jgi:hypothetical protein